MRDEMRMHWMGRRKLVLLPLFAVGAIAFAGLFGFLVMSLWNWLMPALFGWRALTFWQALGLLVLCRILFGSFGGGSRRNVERNLRWRRRMLERWEQMSPEEREKFREGLRGRCGPFGPKHAEPGA